MELIALLTGFITAWVAPFYNATLKQKIRFITFSLLVTVLLMWLYLHVTENMSAYRATAIFFISVGVVGSVVFNKQIYPKLNSLQIIIINLLALAYIIHSDYLLLIAIIPITTILLYSNFRFAQQTYYLYNVLLSLIGIFSPHNNALAWAITGYFIAHILSSLYAMISIKYGNEMFDKRYKKIDITPENSLIIIAIIIMFEVLLRLSDPITALAMSALLTSVITNNLYVNKLTT